MPISFIFQMLENKLKKGLQMTGEYIGDDDSGFEIDTEAFEIEEPIDPDKLSINLKVMLYFLPFLHILFLPISVFTFRFRLKKTDSMIALKSQ